MGWVSHERLGFNYRLTDLQAAIGVAQLERADELLGGPRPGGRAVRGAPRRRWALRRRARATPRAWCCRAATGARAAQLVRLPASCSPTGTDRDALVAELGERGIEAKAYMPCIHLLPHYRERFGFGEGQFPVAEDASTRLLALPFFGAMGEQQVERVCAALARALGLSSA